MFKISKSILLSKVPQKYSQLNTLLNGHANIYFKVYNSFSKKPQLKKKKYEYDPSNIKPKSQQDYISLPDNLKKNVVQVRHMLTPSQANVQLQTLKVITIDQRKLLERSLKQQIQRQLEPIEVEKKDQSKISKLVNKYHVNEELNKYYILRPLKYLQNLYFNMFLGNILGMGWFQYLNDYNSIGWFFGGFTSPAAATALAVLIGYNFSFWIVRQIFHIHISLNQIQSKDISLVSTTWRNIFELSFIACNFSILMYSLSFGFAYPLYKTYILLAVSNFLHLGLNLYEILKSTSSFHKVYIIDFIRILSAMSLLILLFGIYYIQIASSKKIDESIESVEYRERIMAVGNGYSEFLGYFKHKKYQMKEDQKINPQDAE